MDNGLFKAILKLLHDEDFAYLRSKSGQYPLTWTQFTQEKMPSGMTEEETWKLLSAIRRQTAATLSWKSYQRPGCELWYATTESMIDDLRFIEAKSRTDGSLGYLLTEQLFTELLQDMAANELLSALYRDGASLQYLKIIELITGHNTPSSPQEWALLNTYNLLTHIDEYKTRTFDLTLLYEFYGIIASHTEGCVLQAHERGLGSTLGEYSNQSFVVQKVLELYNRSQFGGRTIHLTIHALGAQSLLWDFHPLPSWNALVEVAMRRLFFLKEGYNVLGYLPIGKAYLDWERGELVPPYVIAKWAEEEPDCDEGFDCTAQFASYFKILVCELKKFEEETNKIKAQKGVYIHKVRESDILNLRQKDVCIEMLEKPSTELTIDAHRAKHRIVYSTARNDLLQLVSLGLLDKSNRESLFVFHSSRLFFDLIESKL